jgi:integrase
MFSTVSEWIYTISDSETTRPTYARILEKFARIAKLDLDQTIHQWKEAKYDPAEKERFIDYVSEKVQKFYLYSLQRKLASGTIKNLYTTTKSFFNFYNIPINVKTRTHVFVTYHNRDILKDEIKQILENSGLRERTFYLMMLESGQRPDTLVKLQYKHIKREYESNKIPMMIELPSNIIKDRLGYRFSFIGDEAYKSLREYLKTRPRLRDDDYIFSREKRLEMDATKHITPNTFGNYFSRLALKLGIAERREKGKPKAVKLYCLRKYFRNHCAAEVSFREFWMSHSIGTDEHYITRDVESHRKKYAECYSHLRLSETSPDAFVKVSRQLEEKDQQIKSLQETVEKLKPLMELAKMFQEPEDFKAFMKSAIRSYSPSTNTIEMIKLNVPDRFLDIVIEKAKAEGISEVKAYQQLVDDALENSAKQYDMQSPDKGKKLTKPQE